MKLTKRLLAMLLTVVMVLSMLPAIALTASAVNTGTVFNLVTSLSDITDGDYIILGKLQTGTNANKQYLMKDAGSTSANVSGDLYQTASSVPASITYDGSTVAANKIWHFDYQESGTNQGKVSIQGSSGNFFKNNGSSNGSRMNASLSQYMTFAASGNFSNAFTMNTSGSGRTYFNFNYNSGNVIFGFYTAQNNSSTMQAAFYLYKASTTPVTTTYAVTYSQPASGGTFTVKSGNTTVTSGTEVNENTSLTLTATPASSAYVFSGWTVTGSTGPSPATTNPATITVTAATTISATFTARTAASITLSRNGATETPSGTYYVGDSYTLPGAGADVNGHKHVGWSSVTIPTPGSKPTTNYYELGAEIPSLGSSQTYYAVYAQQSGTAEVTTWDLVSAANNVTAGDYVITWNNSLYLPSETTANSNPAVGSGITVSNDKLTNTVTSAMQWTFTGDNTNGFTVSHTNSGTTYYLVSSNTAQGISVSTSSTTIKWKASVDGTYGMLLRGSDGGTRNLAVYNSGSWRYYATGSSYSGTLRLYKKTTSQGGASYTNYTTSPVAPSVDTYAVTITQPSNGSITTNDTLIGLEAGDVITLTANPNTGYEIDEWTITGAADAIEDGNDVAIEIGSSDVTATVSFQKINYTITKSAANGTITAAATANYNDSVSFTVAPNSGYQIDSVTVKDASNNNVTVSGSNGSYSFTMPASNVTITATCSALPTYSYTIYNNGTSVGSGTAASVTAPAAPSPSSIQYTDPDTLTTSTFTFAGWAVQDSTITTPGAYSGNTLYQAGETIPLSANGTVIRAIFVNGSGAGWYLVDDYTSLEDGVYAIISPNYYAFNGTISSGHGQKTADAFSFDANGYAASAPEGTLELTFTSTANGFTLYNETLGYLYASKASSGGLAFHASEDSGWSFSADGGLYAANNAHLRSYNDTFRTYDGNSNATIHLAAKNSSSYLTEAGAPYYAVTYYENAGGDTVTNMPSNTSVRQGTSYTVPNTIPVCDGYRFDGWATSPSGSVVYAAASLPATISSVSAAVNLYAKWTLRATVTFYDTDNTTIFDTVYTYAGETPTAPASNPTKADSDPHYYTFAGWSRTAGGTVESPLAVIGSSESTRAYYPVFTEHTRIEAVDDSFVLDFDRNATLDVLANDRNTDGVTLTLGTAPAGITLTKNANNTITFTVPGGQLTTASYTFTYTLTKSGETDSTATVTVKPASAIYYEDNNTDFFTYNDGEDGTWSEVGIDNAWLQDASAAADGFDAANNSLTWSAGVAHKANVVFDEDKDRDWPTMEFTFVGNAFSISMMRNNYTGLVAVYVDGTKVKNLPTAYGATGGEYDPEADYGGFIYESSDSNYGMPAFYWAADGGTVGTHSVKVEVLYSSMYDHNSPKAGNYDVYIDGVTIYNPIVGSTVYNYISFRDTVLATGSLGVPTTTPHNYVATLSPASLSLNTGNTGVLQLSLTDENVPVYSGYTVVYTSSNPSIATVTAAGSLNTTTGVNTATVTGVGAGQATITATITTPGSTTLTRTATVIVSETGKTVNYYVNGTVWDSEQVAEGNDPSFPNVIGAYNELAGYSHDYTFLGWIPAAIAEDTTTQPATIYTSGDSYELTGATAFYAVFTYTGAGSAAAGYSLSDSAPEAGDNFIIAAKIDGTYYALNHSRSTTALTITNGAVADTTNVVWKLTAKTNGDYVQTDEETGTDAFKLNSSSTNYNGISDVTTSSNTGAMSFAANGDGFDMYGTYNTGRHLGLSASTASVQSSAQTLYIFKYSTTGGSASYYATTLGTAAPITHSYAASITPSSLALHPGETGSVSATLTDNGATVTGATPTYTTSLASVATVAADGTVTAVANGNATITATYTVGGTDYTATCSVAVTTLATYNVTYYVNGSQYGQVESVTQGDSPSFTAPVYDVSGYNAHAYEFLGWKEGSALSADTTETQTLYVAGNTHVISGNTTYYAVYRYTEGGGALTEAIDLGTGASGQYVIAANVGGTYYAMSNTFAAKISGTSITNPGSSISSSDATNYVVTIAKTNDGFTISNGTTLLGYSGSSTNFSTDGTTNTYWTISTDTKWSGTYAIRNVNTDTRGVAFNGTQFGAYSTSNTSGYYDVEIIPVGDSSSATYYATTLNVAAAHSYVASISPTSVTIEAGQETTAIGTLTDNGITTTAYTPTYTSSNTGVATVSSIGYVDAISAGSATITVSYSVDGTTYSATCAVTVTAAPVVTTYTVSYYVNGSLYETETVAENGHPDFDAPTTDVSAYDAQDYSFAGWAANTVSDTTTAPTMYTASTASSYTVTGDVTFHAVYTWTEGGSGSGSGTASYTKVTSTSDLADGKYLIVCENVSMAMTDAVDGTSNGTSVTIDNGTIASSSAVDALQFTLTKSNGALQGPNGKYIGNASNSNALTASETALTNTITFSSGDANIVSSGGAYLRYNKTSGQERFRYYKSSSYTSQQAIQLYKYVTSGGSGSGSSTSYYTTTLAAGDGETATLSVSPSSMSLSTGGYGQIAVTAANGGANAYVTATSSSNSVAQVYALNDGNNTFGVTAGSAGSATITIRYFDSSNTQLASQTVSVTVTAASGTGGTNADYGRVGSDGNAPTTSGSTNAGTRGVVATSISQKAADYYTAKGVTWADLTALSGVYTNSSVTAASGNALKSQLDSLMNLTNTVTYSSLTTYWPNTDKSNGSSQNLYIYSNVTSNSSVSREHVWPKSRGQFYESGAGSDLQHLRPEESTVNSTRGNHTMGYVNGVISGCSTKTYGGNTVLWYNGSYSSNDCSGLVEVMDCCKGDVARILLYVYTAYPENTNLFTKTSGGGSGNNASDGNKVIESLNTLLEWCALDPVDTWEMSRNDAVQTIQGNRNVYIDYPELAWMIFNLTPPTTMQTPSGQAAAGNVGTRNSANYYTSAVNNTAIMSEDPAPETRGSATRAVGGANSDLPVTGAVMLNGIGQISNNDDVMSYLAQYGAQNCLVIPASGSVVFYLTGGSAESQIAIGASALNGTGTTLKVYQISAVSGSSATGTILVEQSLVSSTEMYFAINGIAWTGEKSNVLMVRNEGSAPMLLTNLRAATGTVEGHISTGGTESVGGATRAITRSTDNELQMVIDASAILAGIAGVQSINEGTFDETPVDPVDPVDPVESDIVLRGNSISLNGQIDVNFYVDVPAELLASGVYATLDGVRADFAEGTYGTMVSKKLPAKEMNTKVTLKLYAADGTPLTFLNGSTAVTEHSYSVQDYLSYVIGNPATYGDELVKLCKAMSDYGAYTQIALDFDVENAKAIYLPDEIAAVTCTGCDYSFTPNTENITFLGASVVTESETAIRVYFALSGEGFTATVDGEPAAIRTNERGTFVEIANISAKNLGDTHTIAVTNGSETVTVSDYSAYSYVQSVLSYAGASDSLKLAVKALKLYGDLAAAYFNK